MPPATAGVTVTPLVQLAECQCSLTLLLPRRSKTTGRMHLSEVIGATGSSTAPSRTGTAARARPSGVPVVLRLLPVGRS